MIDTSPVPLFLNIFVQDLVILDQLEAALKHIIRYMYLSQVIEASMNAS